MRIFLPLEWWKLSFLWLANLKSRTPPARRLSLFRNSLRAAIFGLSLGIGALSVTLAVVSGFQYVLAAGTARALGDVTYYTKWRSFEELDSLVKQTPPGLSRAEYFWNSQGLLVGPKGGRGVLLEGRRDVKFQTQNPGAKAADTSTESPVEISLGKPLAEYLGVKEGDSVRMLLPGVVRGAVPAQVKSLLSYGMYEIDSRLAIIKDETLRPVIAQKDPEAFASRPGDAFGIRFFLDSTASDPLKTEALENWKSSYSKVLRERSPYQDEEPVLKTWMEQKRNLFGAIGLDKKILTLVLSLLTLVAALNIAATLVVLFLERDREIATLQALGMSGAHLVQWICVQGILLGLASSVLGLGMGRLMGWAILQSPLAEIPSDIYNISRLPLRFIFSEQAWVFGFGIGASLLVSFVLGWGLAKQKLLLVLAQRR